MSKKPYPLSAAEWDWEVIHELQVLDYEEDAQLEYKGRLKYETGLPVGEREWKRDIEREFTAFANTHGGILLFGMSDSRNPSGFEKTENDPAQIVGQYVQNTTPLVDLDTSGFVEHPHRKEKGFLAVEVKEANTKPVATGDAAYYIRTAHGKSPMPREHIQSLFVERDRRQQAVLKLLVEMDRAKSACDSHVDVSTASGPPPFGALDTEALRDALLNCTHLYTQSNVQDEIRYVLKFLRDIDELDRNYGRHKSPYATNPDSGQSWRDENVRDRFKTLVEDVLRHLKNLRQEAQIQDRYEEKF